MGGSKGGILSKWIKEFAVIVLIQTLQAFIFAIIMILIIKSGAAYVSAGTEESSENASMAMGVLGIVGLASLSKMEDLVKKMLGVGPSVTDPSLKGGMKSFATGMVAAKLAGRVTNNLGNVTGGVRKIAQGNKSEQKLLAKRQRIMEMRTGVTGKESPEKLNSIASRSNFPNAKGSGTATGISSNSGNGNQSQLSEEDKKRQKALLEEKQKLEESHVASGNQDKLASKNGVMLHTPASQKNNRLAQINKELNGLGAVPNVQMPNTSGDLGNAMNNGGLSSGDIKQMKNSDAIAAQELIDGYDEKITEIKKNKTEGYKDIAKGLTGTLAAGAGLIVGAGAGAALGEMNDVVKAAGAGIGVGDYIGEKAIEMPTGAVDVIKKSMDGKEVRSSVKQLRTQYKKQTEAVQSIIDNQRREIDAGNMDR